MRGIYILMGAIDHLTTRSPLDSADVASAYRLRNIVHVMFLTERARIAETLTRENYYDNRD